MKANLYFEKLDIRYLDELGLITRKTFKDQFGDQNTPENMELYLKTTFNNEQLATELANSNCEFYLPKLMRKQ